MKAAGCIVIGKTNTPEFGLGSHTFNEVFGVTRNAYDPSKSAGGSSGGAAVALATRMLPVADGSDFMGSLRNPAAWNNVFGLRPSQGRVPLWPAPDVWVSQLGTEGPMGRTVRDVAMLLDVQAGYDARAPLSLHDGERFAQALDDFDGKDVRIGWLGDLSGYLPMERGILESCEQGLRRLRDVRLRGRADAARLRAGRRVAGVADLAALAGRGAHRALPREPAEPRADQARSAVGVRPGRKPDRRASLERERPAQRVLPAAAGTLRALRLSGAAVGAGVAVRRRATLADARSKAARWTPITAGWRW